MRPSVSYWGFDALPWCNECGVLRVALRMRLSAFLPPSSYSSFLLFFLPPLLSLEAVLVAEHDAAKRLARTAARSMREVTARANGAAATAMGGGRGSAARGLAPLPEPFQARAASAHSAGARGSVAPSPPRRARGHGDALRASRSVTWSTDVQ